MQGLAKQEIDLVGNDCSVGVESVQLPRIERDWYLTEYPDVARIPMKPETHYRVYGHRLGRDASPDFPTVFYRALLKLSGTQDPLRALEKLAVGGNVPKTEAISGRVLLAAERLGLSGRVEEALTLAERWLPQSKQHQANVIRANLAAQQDDEGAWLEATNAYLRYFNVAPITLAGDGSLFDRIQASVEPVAEEGPKVSIVLTAWNSERTVAKALESLLAQSWRNVEVLVVDDCSTDGTWDVVEEVAGRDSRVKGWRNAENVGPYVSKSLAAAYATGEWITCHDADDWAHPERIARQVQFCLDNRVDACLAGMLRLSNDGQYTRLNEVGGFVHDGACRSAFVSLFMGTQLYRDLLGSWDQVRAGGDSELLRRLEKVTGRKVRQLPVPTMYCRDHEQSLTNHARFGLSVRADDGARHRLIYKHSYLEAHGALTRFTSRYTFPSASPRYDSRDLQVPLDSVLKVAEPHWPQLRQSVEADVVIVTNLRFPGGNASSTLDEIRYFQSNGLTVALVHCPVDTDLGRGISQRYGPFQGITYQWSMVESINARVLICRHPRVLVSSAFREITPKIRAGHAFVVKNNSCRRPNGASVYDLGEMISAAMRLDVGSLEFCPISQAMRAELMGWPSEDAASLRTSRVDWTPTFDAALYRRAPKPTIQRPFRIGRHGRDGREKWRERRHELLQAYPDTSEFRIQILGGASRAAQILGQVPDNWNVWEFGDIEPVSFLEKLDVFVYFPNSQLVEGFGRTIVEAMIAGVPVIVPPSLEETFGALVLVCEPEHVRDVVHRLSRDDDSRVAYLREVQEIAIARYGASSIADRLQESSLGLVLPGGGARAGLSERSLGYRASVLQNR